MNEFWEKDTRPAADAAVDAAFARYFELFLDEPEAWADTEPDVDELTKLADAECDARLAGLDAEAELEPEPEASDLGRFEPTPYDLGITDDPGANWPPPVNGIRPSPEVVAASFGCASVAEMEAAAECARDADIDAEVEARLDREALEADGLEAEL